MKTEADEQVIITEHTDSTIRTFSGKYFDFINPKPEQICIEDVAHGLSQTCRYAGQFPKFYSVAQHSIWVCEAVEHISWRIALQGLLHDATEAYICDVASPLKKYLPDYKEIEGGLHMAISEQFNTTYPFCAEVKEADKLALEYEWRFGMLDDCKEITCWSPRKAEYEFLTKYYSLIK